MGYNLSWSDRVTNEELHGDLIKVSNTIKQLRLKLAGHTFGDKTSPAHQIAAWIPTHGQAEREGDLKRLLLVRFSEIQCRGIRKMHARSKNMVSSVLMSV